MRYLVAGLAGAFIMPAAMLAMQVLPVSRLQIGLLGRAMLDDSAEGAVVGSQAAERTASPPRKP